VPDNGAQRLNRVRVKSWQMRFCSRLSVIKVFETASRISEVRLPELVWRRRLIVELVRGLHHDEGWAGDQIVGQRLRSIPKMKLQASEPSGRESLQSQTRSLLALTWPNEPTPSITAISPTNGRPARSRRDGRFCNAVLAFSARIVTFEEAEALRDQER
jgi:hypothetical protein